MPALSVLNTIVTTEVRETTLVTLTLLICDQ